MHIVPYNLTQYQQIKAK